MGGQSFKCPMCEKWFLSAGSLKDHSKQKHSTRIEVHGFNDYKLSPIEPKKAANARSH